MRFGPCGNIIAVGRTPAIPARAVPRRKSRRFVQKEQFRPIPSGHDGSFAALPIKRAANPRVVGPARGSKRPVIAMNNAAIARERAAGGNGGNFAGRKDAVLQGH